MIKRFYLALAILAGLLSPAYSAGTISFSLSQQLDAAGKPLAGCKLYFFAAGTSTPQIAYQDTALTQPVPGGSQLTCDAAGRLPQFFLADGLIKVRLTDKNGVNQAYPNGATALDNILVIGPSSGGGGGGGTVDPTTIMATGDLKAKYGTGVLTGFVRANGRTIGSATSGATERANADAQALFEYLWGVDTTLVVSTGRGASANADWVANKTIALPDWRGRNLAALDDMGNSAAGIISTTYFGADPTILGSVGGNQAKTIATPNLPPYTPSGTVAGSISGSATNGQTGVMQAGVGAVAPSVQNGQPDGRSLAVTGTFSGTLAGTAQGGTSAAFGVMNPSKLTTFYIKL